MYSHLSTPSPPLNISEKIDLGCIRFAPSAKPKFWPRHFPFGKCEPIPDRSCTSQIMHLLPPPHKAICISDTYTDDSTVLPSIKVCKNVWWLQAPRHGKFLGWGGVFTGTWIKRSSKFKTRHSGSLSSEKKFKGAKSPKPTAVETGL